MSTPYKGPYIPTNPQKYAGDVNKITYRSLWERNAFRWLDQNPNVVEWASEEIAIPYANPVTGKRSRYYPDLFIKFKDGSIVVVEIKPDKQTREPQQPKRRTKQYLNEVATYAVNSEKWKAAQKLAHRNEFEFQIWTEHHLEKLGIPTGATDVDKGNKRVKRLKPRKINSPKRPTRRS